MSDYLDEIRRHAQQAADGTPPTPAFAARIVITYTTERRIVVSMIGTDDELVIRGLYDKARVVLDEHFQQQASSRIVRPPG